MFIMPIPDTEDDDDDDDLSPQRKKKNKVYYTYLALLSLHYNVMLLCLQDAETNY